LDPITILAFQTKVAYSSHNSIPSQYQPYVRSGPIMCIIDTGAETNLIREEYIHHNAFRNVRPPNREISVSGISSTDTPIKVNYTGQHAILGEVLFGPFASNLIGVPQLMRNGFELHCVGNTMAITRSSNQTVVYTGQRNNKLYECDINVTPVVLEAFHAVYTPMPPLPNSSSSSSSTQSRGTLN